MDDNVEYLIQVLNNVIHILDKSNMDNQSAFMDTVVLRLEYLQRFVVNLDIDDGVTEIICTAYRSIIRYTAPLARSGRKGRPSFDVSEEQLSFLLEQGFKVATISNVLGVSVRTVERRMSTFGLSVLGKK